MQAYDELWWNPDQVVAWAETRERDAVGFAELEKAGIILPSTKRIAEWVLEAASHAAEAGRDVNAELWAKSGWPLEEQRYSILGESFAEALACPELPEAKALIDAAACASENDRFCLRLIFASEAGFKNERDIPSSHPTLAHLAPDLRQLVRAYCARAEPPAGDHERRLRKFPTSKYVLWLLRQGRLWGRGCLPGEVLARNLTPDDWATLEIQVGGVHNRLGVWRTLPPAENSPGDIDKVRIRRAEVLLEFPASPPRKVGTDDDARGIIREAMAKNGGYITQRNGAEIVCRQFPEFLKQRAMELVKELTENTKRGPRGPRQKLSSKLSAKNSEPDN
jgi:hypothetical protein